MPKNITCLLKNLFLVLVLVCTGCATRDLQAKPPPNIVIILTDDQSLDEETRGQAVMIGSRGSGIAGVGPGVMTLQTST